MISFHSHSVLILFLFLFLFLAQECLCQNCSLRIKSLFCSFDSLLSLNQERTSFSHGIEIDCNYSSSSSFSSSSSQSQESTLKTNHFDYLPQLLSLQVSDCNIRRIPPLAFSGLSGLESLILRGSLASSLQIENDGLRGLSTLKSLELTFHRGLNLSPGSFCSLDNLQALNLSHNSLRHIQNTGFETSSSSSPCVSSSVLTVLDLGFNALTHFSLRSLSNFTSLNSLYLNDNLLKGLESERYTEGTQEYDDNDDEGRKGLRVLSFLSLANNQLKALSSSYPLLSHSPLKELHLQNNSLSFLHSKLFFNHFHLRLLNLSQNELGDFGLSEGVFDSLDSLRVLDLSYNSLSTLNPRLFSSLKNLIYCNLHHNFLLSLHSETFLFNTKISFLQLSNNQLTSLSSSTLKSLHSLQSLSLNHNHLHSLPLQFFQSSNESLLELYLHHNYLTDVPEALSTCSRLQNLDLGENLISNSSVSLNSLRDLIGLSLAGNKLYNLSSNFFSKDSNLHILNLSHNQLTSLSQDVFSSLSQLRILRLEYNHLVDINGLLTSQSELELLNISSNALQWFDYAFIPKNLKWLDLHNNQIEDLGNYYGLINGFSLQTLDVSFNRLKKLGIYSFPSSLQHILIHHNLIESIEPMSFSKQTQLRRVELSHNKLRALALSSLTVFFNDTREETPQFTLSHNPFVCDCDMEYLQKINNESSPHTPHISDLTQLTCFPSLSQISSSSSSLRLSSLVSKDFLCQYKAHCFALCNCCDFFACDCRMQCPFGCDCFHDPTWSTNIISCSSRGLSDVPALLPMDATSIHLDGNNLTGTLFSQSFIGRKRVQFLYLNQSGIESLSNQTFNGLTNLRVLYLQNNALSKLQGIEFSNLTSLLELWLQFNILTFIHSETFAPLVSLEKLYLEGNQLLSLSLLHLTFLPYLSTLSLSGNPWTCHCSFITKLQSFVSTGVLTDVKFLKCFSDSGVEKNLLSSFGADNQTCFSSLAATQTNISSESLLPLFLSVLLSSLLFLITLTLLLYFKTPLLIWLHSTTGFRFRGCGNQDEKCNYTYDAFLSYCVSDKSWVHQILAPSLESSSYKLILQHRDLESSTSMSAIVSLCAKHILIVSPSYLETEWSEIQLILSKVYNYSSSSSSFWSTVLLVLLQDLSSLNLSSYSDFKSLTKNAVVLTWNSSGFWSKLLFYLPETSKSSYFSSTTNSINSKLGKRRTRTTQRGKNVAESPKSLASSSSSTRSTVLDESRSSCNQVQEGRRPSSSQPSSTSVYQRPNSYFNKFQSQTWYSDESSNSPSTTYWTDHTYQTIGECNLVKIYGGKATDSFVQMTEKDHEFSSETKTFALKKTYSPSLPSHNGGYLV